MVDHPGPSAVELTAAIVQELIDHARGEYPNEACGIIAGSALPAVGGRATRWFPARNQYASPLRYNIDPPDLLRIYTAIDDADEEVWAIVHSHVRSAARPSPTDIGQATWPESLYILVSLNDPEPDVRAWRIVDAQVHEVTVEVTG